MTNIQFYTLIAIPILGILLNSIVSVILNSRISSVEARMLALESTFSTRFDLLIGKIGDIDNRLVRLEERLERR